MNSVRRPLNQENEVLRKNVEGPPDMKENIDLLLRKTSQVHAAFLFEARNREALQKLCLLLSATRTTHQYKGWESFGSKVGLSSEQIKCIDFHFNLEDPAYFTLKAFVQRRDSTLDKVVSALESIRRYDIILQMKDYFIEVADDVITSHQTADREESGYFSLSESGDEQQSSQSSVIIPSFLPSVPLIFQNFQSTRVHDTIQSTNIQTFKQESYQTTSARAPRPKYTKKVMVTFASDGEDIAFKVASVFRKEEEEKQKIGVVILNEHVSKVNACPEQFIFSCFEQVDYIIPIITEGYLKAISNKSASAADVSNSVLQCIDPHYVKYIYTLMVTDYMHKSCINDKVRCIIPDKMLFFIQNHFLSKSPLFQAWVKQSETEDLKLRLLRSNI